VSELIIGIDPSLNCTGICVRYKDYEKFYVVTSHKEKRFITDCENHNINYIYCEIPKKSHNSSTDALNETRRIIYISKQISAVVGSEIALNRVCDCLVRMEGCALRALGKVESLFALQHIIRERLIELGVNIEIRTPSNNKKLFTGKGNANKELMVSTFLQEHKELTDITAKFLDDIADAYSLTAN